MKGQKTQEWIRIDNRFNAATVNWDEVQELVGTIVQKKEVEWNGQLRKLVVLSTDSGDLTVWCTVRLGVLYDLDEGTEVRIVNKGWSRTKSGRRVRDFEIWVRP